MALNRTPNIDSTQRRSTFQRLMGALSCVSLRPMRYIICPKALKPNHTLQGPKYIQIPCSKLFADTPISSCPIFLLLKATLSPPLLQTFRVPSLRACVRAYHFSEGRDKCYLNPTTDLVRTGHKTLNLGSIPHPVMGTTRDYCSYIKALLSPC